MAHFNLKKIPRWESLKYYKKDSPVLFKSIKSNNLPKKMI